MAALLNFLTIGPDRYLEPFCGSAAVHFRISAREAIISDINHHLINFYQTVRVHADDVYKCVIQYPRDRDTYYYLRNIFNTSCNSFESACLFYYLNKNCFNGLFRTAKNGNFNVPYSMARVGNYPSGEEFAKAAESLNSTTILCADFEEVILEHTREDDLVYLDPPYSDAKRYPFREYFPGCFSSADVVRLLSVLETIHDRGAYFVLTFSDRLNIPFAERGWSVHSVRTRRNISGFASARRYVDDVIVTNRKLAT